MANKKFIAVAGDFVFGADQKPKADASGSSKLPPPAKPEAKPEQKSTTESRESRPEWSEYL